MEIPNILQEFGLDRDTAQKINDIRRADFYQNRIIPFEQIFIDTRERRRDAQIKNCINLASIPSMFSMIMAVTPEMFKEKFGYDFEDSDE